ncbi:hypothetical protein LRH25_06635 [Ideonella azotifigens]|uniref:hypothetical protein n=1 Tax=Ideonella azotifigens TaxID=513160 RepID=UPI0011438537|nr:hypothetical protein [Ideonella azotifigens]MCD2340016.1 hypothetical protein [Ideonella azotifigens]
MAFLLCLAAPLASAAAAAEDSRTPIYIHRAATGNLEGLKNGIGLTVEACRAAKNLPPGGPVKLPSDEYLRKLQVVESEEYFDKASHAGYNTYRKVAADPASGSCELALFTERHAWAGQECGQATNGGSASMKELLDYENPVVPKVELNTVAASRAGCGKKAKAYDLTGLPAEDAGGARCVWDSDVVAKSMREAGLTAEGHKKDSPAADYCLYERQPIYVYNGHHELVVLKGSGSTQGDVLDGLLGETTAFLNDRLLSMTDGTPIPAERFSAAAVRSFVSQPAKTSLGDRR